MKIQKKNFFFLGGWGGPGGRVGGSGLGGLGCERRIEVLVKIKKKIGGGGVGSGGLGGGSGWM